jgi:isopropylmalate/homocitrate/citramalate synthase
MANDNQPWKSDKWWVSHYNFEPAVTQGFNPPKSVKIYDVTLRDGEQQTGIMFSKEQKLRIAEELAAVGVHRIEVCFPIVSKEDETALREIVKRDFGPEIFAACRSIPSEVYKAADCGVDGIILVAPASDQVIEQGLGWKREYALEIATQTSLVAKNLGLYTIFFPFDASRTDLDTYCKFVEDVARDGHIDSLAVVDTVGVLTPQAAAHVVKTLKQRLNLPLECHFHNTFGMAVANTAAAVMHGAEAIHTSVTGIGEGSGNCCMEEVVMALKVLYGVDSGLNYERLYGASKLVHEMAGTWPNRPLVGERTYDLETGETLIFYRRVWDKSPTVWFPLMPDYVGHPDPKIVLGKKSGIDGVELMAEKLGYAISRDQGREAVYRVKDLAIEKRRSITEEEFREILEDVVNGTAGVSRRA